MTPETSTPRTDAIAHRGYNESAYIAEMTDLARQLERELFANHEATKLMGKWLEDERALADRLAGELQWWGDYCGDSAPASIDLALDAWKEARK